MTRRGDKGNFWKEAWSPPNQQVLLLQLYRRDTGKWVQQGKLAGCSKCARAYASHAVKRSTWMSSLRSHSPRYEDAGWGLCGGVQVSCGETAAAQDGGVGWVDKTVAPSTGICRVGTDRERKQSSRGKTDNMA